MEPRRSNPSPIQLKGPERLGIGPMFERLKVSREPAQKTRWPISFQDDGLSGPIIQINALYRWVFVYLD